MPGEFMRYLVTGGAGFIGENLVRYLLDNGHDVTVIDNLSTSIGESITKLPCSFIYGDISNNWTLTKLIPRIGNIDCIFHLAALPRVQVSIDEPIRSNTNNVTGTLNVLELARKLGNVPVVYASSSSVYGDIPELPWNETMIPKPMSPYALQKLIGEQYCKLYSELYGLSTICLRFFNVYGDGINDKPASPYNLVLSIFKTQCDQGEALTITGDGEQKRDFTWVGDIINGLMKASVGTGHGEHINLGSGVNYSVNEIAAMFSSHTRYISPRIEVRESLANIEKAKSLLNWEPTMELREWIQRYKTQI